MIIVSICGSAGRNGSHTRITLALFNKLYNVFNDSIFKLHNDIKSMYNTEHKITLMSGGAAFVDHIAVRIYLNNLDRYKLHLALPCNITVNGFTGNKVAETASYYHDLFRKQTSINSVSEIIQAIQKGATFSIHNGFKERNTVIANCNYILASSWGPNPTGGTKNTYDKCQTVQKFYINLDTL